MEFPHTDFAGAFTPGTTFLKGKMKWTMEVASWGRLVTPTGRLIACDIVGGPSRVKPFRRAVEPGSYPVEICSNGGETCAMRVRFSKRKTASWEPALRVGERAAKTREDKPPCFGVDSGVAGIFDLKAAKVASEDEAWQDRVYTSGIHAHELDPKSGAGMVWCHSGRGDGAYPSYWGLDRSRDISELVLDFYVLVEAIYDEHVVTNLLEKIGTELDDPWFAKSGCTNVKLTWSKNKKELRVEYHDSDDSIEVELLGKHSGGGSGGPASSRFFFRRFDLTKQRKNKLVFRKYMGLRSLPRG